jgi:hypothetical protein
MKTISIILALLVTGCSVDVGPDKDGGAKPSPKLTLSSKAMDGTVDGQGWAPVYAIARVDNGEYNIILAGPGQALTCMNWFPKQPSVQFTVPAAPGTYEWDMNAPVSGSRIVNVIFPYKTNNGGGATTVLAEVSVIRVDSMVNGMLNGAMAAQATGSEHSYSLNGLFSAQICP